MSIDPRAQGFTYYIDHMVNQFYLGCETPLPRLFSTPGFTEASARAALDLQDMLIDPVQRMVKRRVEREIFAVVAEQNGFDPVKAQVRLNWGSPETPEILMSDLIAAATGSAPLIRPEEFRKNALSLVGSYGILNRKIQYRSRSSIEKLSSEVSFFLGSSRYKF